MEDRLFHKIFVLIHSLSGWPDWGLALGLLVMSLPAWLAWQLAGLNGTVAGVLYLAFSAGDWLLLWWLPRSKRSFGPLGPQLFVLNLPRLGAAILAATAAGLLGSMAAGIGLLVGLQLFGTLVYLWAAGREPFALSVSQQTVTLPQFSAETKTIQLLHISDLHVERFTRREAHLLALVEQLRPDLIVITGDYLNLSYVDDPVARAEVRRLLAELRAPWGVYATLGSPPADPRHSTPSLFDGLDHIRLLRDEMAIITLPEGQKLSLLGLDCEHDLDSDASVFRHLVELAPADSARLLLYHSPELMPLVRQYPIDLYLCGHTHGGQVRLPGYGAIFTSSVTGKQYEMGRYDEEGTTLYVSRGVGLEGLSAPRMRLLCPPEVTLFTLSA